MDCVGSASGVCGVENGPPVMSGFLRGGVCVGSRLGLEANGQLKGLEERRGGEERACVGSVGWVKGVGTACVGRVYMHVQFGSYAGVSVHRADPRSGLTESGSCQCHATRDRTG